MRCMEEQQGGDVSPTPKTTHSQWVKITGISVIANAVLLTAGFVTAMVLWSRHVREERQIHDEDRARQEQALAAIKDEVHASGAMAVVNAKDTIFNCLASNTEITCTITNLSAEPMATCVQGSLTQKRASGIKLTSLPVCTGRMGKLETKTLQAHWKGGFAKDICTREGGGILALDWDQCEFRSDPIDMDKFVPPLAPSQASK